MKTFHVGQEVEDTWYFELGKGVVKKVLKTRIKVYFERLNNINYLHTLGLDAANGLVTYDKPHYKFLKKHE